MSTRMILVGILAVGALLPAPAPLAAADPLVEVAKEANRKMVKLFGAGGFSRLNNYATGIIVSPQGHIITVASQILDTPDLVVHLYDGTRLPAQVLVTERELDIALLKVKSPGKKLEDPLDEPLEYFDFLAAAKRPPAEVGDWVIALSNTFEIALRDEPLSVQRGVIAAYTKMAGRRGVFEFPYTGDVYIVDAITNNPGAAGGALLNRKGELIGIIGRELKNTLSETWMNYAIPVTGKAEVVQRVLVKDKDGNVVKDKDGKEVYEEKTVTVTMAQFVELGMQGKYKPIEGKSAIGGIGGYHGILFVPNILDRTPAYIEDVVPGSPADKAGLRPDDLVSFIDGEPVISINAFNDYIKKRTRAGTVVRLEVRRGEVLETVELTLEAHPAPPNSSGPPMPPKQ